MRIADPAPAEKIARPHIEIVGLEIPRRRHLEAGHFARREIGLQRLNDPLGQFGLDGKKIGQFAIESLGPNMGVGARVDQLRIHPHPIAGTSHRAFQHMGNAERFADLAQVARAGSILLHRGSADDLQVRDLRQAGENVVVHAVGEEGVLPVVAQVFEGQHGDAFLRRPSSRGDPAGAASSVRLIPEGVIS